MQSREPGTRVDSIPSLNEVYHSENLPPIVKADALQSAERRMLEQMEIADLPERIQVVQMRTRKCKKHAPKPNPNQLSK